MMPLRYIFLSSGHVNRKLSTAALGAYLTSKEAWTLTPHESPPQRPITAQGQPLWHRPMLPTEP